MATNFAFTKRLREVSDTDLSELPRAFLETAAAFDAHALGDQLMVPWGLTWFYGEPVFEAMTPAQRLELNHLTWCSTYMNTMFAEVAVSATNFESAFTTLRKGDGRTAFYMVRESVEEAFHAESFYVMVGKVLARYGLDFAAVSREHAGERAWLAFRTLHTVLGVARADYGLYYLMRYPMNLILKSAERAIHADPLVHPLVRKLAHDHATDEARHMQMSREGALKSLESLPSQALRDAVGVAYAQFTTMVHASGRDVARRFPVAALEWCGVPPDEARRAYRDWRGRVNQRDDTPEEQERARYFVKLNLQYIDELPISAPVKRHIRARITAAKSPDHAGRRWPDLGGVLLGKASLLHQ